MPDAVIRPATPDDLPAVMAMIRAMQAERHVTHADGMTESLVRRSAFGPDPALHLTVADTGLVLVGFAAWFWSFSTFRAGPALTVDALYVKPTHRRRRVAHAIVGALAEECRDRGVAAITWLSARNDAAEAALLKRTGSVTYDNLRFVRATVWSLERTGVVPPGTWRYTKDGTGG